MTSSHGKIILPRETQPTSLLLRGLLAILLTIGFYGLALGIAGGLLFVIYFEIVILERINIRITGLCLIGALTILWAILPRFDRFAAPGARLTQKDHPRLFEAIQSVAEQIGQKMPAEVYLIPSVNAFVNERGGVLGIGRKRIMGIGLPLFQTLTVQQLQSVLAHEFGHFYGGDTRLGPWIYSTRGAIIRTVSSLGKSILQDPFRWYGNLFLRITQAISRRQEYVADALSASVVGKQAVIETLKDIHRVAPAFNAYWDKEVLPIFSNGYRPPIAAGFSQFLRVKSIHEAMDNLLEDSLKSGKSDPYDSHPALPERIQAISALPVIAPASANTAPAIQLLTNITEMELSMLRVLFGKDKIDPLKPVTWEDTGEAIYLKSWEQVVENNRLALTGMTAANLLYFRQVTSPLSNALIAQAGGQVPGEVLRTAVDRVLFAAFAYIMAKSGWKVTTGPGCEIVMVKNGEGIQPFNQVGRLISGEISEEDWSGLCAEWGIDRMVL